MNVIGLDGNDYTVNFCKSKSRSRRQKKSQYHLRARKLLAKIFPYQPRFEEVFLPGSNTANTGSLYADFFIPKENLIVEVHGEQHYNFCSFFHKTKADFYRSKKRDRQKIEWCELNSIKIVILPYNKEDKWKDLVKE